MTIVVWRDKYVNELKIATPRIEVITKYGKFFLYLLKSKIIFLYVNGSNKKKAKTHLKKLSLKGVKSYRDAILPVKKLPDQNNEEATNNANAK